MRRTKKKHSSKPIEEAYFFNSIFDLIKEVEEGNTLKYKGLFDTRNRLFSDSQYNKEYTGVNSFEELKELFNNYTDQGNKQTTIAGNQYAKNQQLTASCEGFFMDVPAYISGIPECMGMYIDEESNRMQEIVINSGIASSVSVNAIKDKANAVFNGIYTQEAENKTRCKISTHLYFYDSEGNKNIKITVNIKNFSDPINSSIHSFILGSPTFTRGLLISFGSMVSRSTTIGTPLATAPEEGKTVINYKELTPNEIFKNITT